MNTEFKVKLTTKNDKAVYNHNPLLPSHLKEDLIVDLALIHTFRIITEEGQNLHLLVDLRNVNSLIADDYTNNNHPLSTLSDKAQHLAGKSIFWKLDCS